MSRESKKREAKKAAKFAARRDKALSKNEALMLRAAEQLDISAKNVELLQSRNDYWRMLLCASAFARGLGNERPISEIVEEVHPALLGINRPAVPGQGAL